MRAAIEVPRDHGWGPTRMLRVELERCGYHVAEWRGVTRIVLLLAGQRPERGAELDLMPRER